MPRLGKTGAAMLLAPLACLCLSANSTSKDRLIVIGPLVEGENLDVQFSFYKPKYQPTYVAYFDAYNPKLPYKEDGVKQTQLSSLGADSDGFATFTASIPGHYLSAGDSISIELGLCETAYKRGIDWSKKRFSCNEVFSIKKGQKVYRVSDEGLFETRNEVYHADESRPAELGIDHDSYQAKNLVKGINFSGRKVPIEKVRLSYFGYGAKPKPLPRAELRLLDHLDDFRDIATKVGAYMTLPLKANIRDLGEGDYEYWFSLAESYYYSRIDLHASKERYGLEEPFFRSSSFFLPLREGHDNERYSFQIVLSDGGAFGDEVILDNVYGAPLSYFGNCLSSQYCVVGGER